MPGVRLEGDVDGSVKTFWRVWKRGEQKVVGIPPELALYLEEDENHEVWIEVREDGNKITLIFPV